MEHKERESMTNFLYIEEVSFHPHASRGSRSRRTTIRTFTVEGEEKNEGHRPHIWWTKTPDFVHVYRGISSMNRVFLGVSHLLHEALLGMRSILFLAKS